MPETGQVEPMRFSPDFDGNAIPDGAEGFDMAAHDGLLAARAATACSRARPSAVMPSD